MLVESILNLNNCLKICKFQNSKELYSGSKTLLLTIIAQHLELIMVENFWKFQACHFPTVWELLRKRCAMRKYCKNLEFQLSPKFSYKKKNNENEEISGLDLAIRKVGLPSRKVFAKSKFRPLSVKYLLKTLFVT